MYVRECGTERQMSTGRVAGRSLAQWVGRHEPEKNGMQCSARMRITNWAELSNHDPPHKKMPQWHCESEANVLCATESRPPGTGLDLTWRAYIKNSNLCRLSPIVWSAHISRFGCDWRGGRIGFCVLMKINRAVTHILVDFTM